MAHVVYANPRSSDGYAPYLVDAQSDGLDVETGVVDFLVTGV